MHTTGSRQLFTRPTALRLLLVAAAAALFIGLQVRSSSPVFAATYTVNSISDSIDDAVGDGVCATGVPDECTLRAAIMESNDDTTHDTIRFDSALFTEGSPATIAVTGTPLPDITEDLTIDAVDRGVILDGSAVGGAGLSVAPTADGVEFHLLGGGSTFEIQNFDTGVLIDGGGFLLGVLQIDGNEIHDITYDGIHIVNTNNTGNITINGNDITAGDDAVRIDVEPATTIVTTTVNITDNELEGLGDEGVDVDYVADLSSTLTVNVNNNGDITGSEDGVDLEYCWDNGGCDAVNDAINFNVNGNDSITGGDEGVDLSVGLNGGASDNDDVNVSVADNGPIAGDGDNGVNTQVLVCCGASDNAVTTTVDGNSSITSNGDDGVDADSEVCCGDSNLSTINVTDNGDITGTGATGVTIFNDTTGATFLIATTDDNRSVSNVTGNGDITGGADAGVLVQSAAGDSDDNQSTVNVNDNGDVRGFNASLAVDITSTATTGDGNASTVNVNGNDSLSAMGGCCSEGVSIDSEASGSDPADDSTSTVNVNDNGNIKGNGDEALFIDSTADGTNGNTSTVTVDGNADITDPSTSGLGADILSSAGVNTDGDDNNSTVEVTNNGDLAGYGGAYVASQAGGGTDGTNNDSAVRVNGNEDILGDTGRAVEVDTEVCCDSANTNTVEVNENDDVASNGDDAINIAGITDEYICCSQNTVDIMDNTKIGPSGDDGIELNVCANSSVPSADTDCLNESETIATISGNVISDNDGRGVTICCGDFGDIGGDRTQISSNTIEDNGATGVYLESVQNAIVGPNNVITGNGTGTGVAVVEATIAGPGLIQGDGNTITKNSIFDNDDAGIDLADNGPDADVTQCTGTGTTPNQCLKQPTLSLIQGTELLGVGCGGCTIDVFVADNIPADQDDSNGDPHGEGKTWLVSTTANTLGAFSVQLCGTPATQITATQTNASGNTSEFAANIDFGGTTTACAPTPGPTNTPGPSSTPGPTSTPVATATLAATATETPTSTVVATPTNTTGPTATPTNTTILPTATRTATRTATPVTPVTPKPPLGDVNGDGNVNSVDSALILQLEAGLIHTLPFMNNADVNEDGHVNSVDASLILQFEAGLIDSLPPG